MLQFCFERLRLVCVFWSKNYWGLNLDRIQISDGTIVNTISGILKMLIFMGLDSKKSKNKTDVKKPTKQVPQAR